VVSRGVASDCVVVSRGVAGDYVVVSCARDPARQQVVLYGC